MFPAVAAAREASSIRRLSALRNLPLLKRRAPIFLLVAKSQGISFVFCSTVVTFLSVLILLLGFLKFYFIFARYCLPVASVYLYHTFLDRLKYTDISRFFPGATATWDYHSGSPCRQACPPPVFSLPVLFEISIGSVDRKPPRSAFQKR